MKESIAYLITAIHNPGEEQQDLYPRLPAFPLWLAVKILNG